MRVTTGGGRKVQAEPREPNDEDGNSNDRGSNAAVEVERGCKQQVKIHLEIKRPSDAQDWVDDGAVAIQTGNKEQITQQGRYRDDIIALFPDRWIDHDDHGRIEGRRQPV